MHHPTALLFALLFTGQLFSLKEKVLDCMKLHFCKDVWLSRCPKTPEKWFCLYLTTQQRLCTFYNVLKDL